MKKIISVLVLILISSHLYADESISIDLDVSLFKATKNQTRISVLKALHLKKWTITSMDDDAINMEYRGDKAKVDLSKFPKVTIMSADESEDLSLSYFESLKKHIYVELIICM